jgi:hypothetical protein
LTDVTPLTLREKLTANPNRAASSSIEQHRAFKDDLLLLKIALFASELIEQLFFA